MLRHNNAVTTGQDFSEIESEFKEYDWLAGMEQS